MPAVTSVAPTAIMLRLSVVWTIRFVLFKKSLSNSIAGLKLLLAAPAR